MSNVCDNIILDIRRITVICKKNILTGSSLSAWRNQRMTKRELYPEEDQCIYEEKKGCLQGNLCKEEKEGSLKIFFARGDLSRRDDEESLELLFWTSRIYQLNRSQW